VVESPVALRIQRGDELHDGRAERDDHPGLPSRRRHDAQVLVMQFDDPGDHELVGRLHGLLGPGRADVHDRAAHGLEQQTVLTSNTSAIPIGRIAEGLADPSRVIGTHFWHPPYLVPLVEAVQATVTSPAVVTATIDLLAAVGLKPVHVAADVPGFIGNRLQHALKREAIALVADGVATAEAVDTVVRQGFGRRLALVGPLEQADLGGADLTLAIHQVLMPDLDVTAEPHPYLAAMVERGDLGAKTGRGFYTWAPGEADRRRAEIAEGLAGQNHGCDPAPADEGEHP
jgi:3-hydroxyacyl-CoA dehydrogenase